MARRIASTEGPTEGLRSRFDQLQISERQWRRAAKQHLRGIAGDLPLFDSAWIDACVCDRLLTSWQADVLNSATPDRFVVGPAIIERIAGVTSEGTLYEGRHQNADRPIEILFLDDSVGAGGDTARLLERLVEYGRTNGSEHIQWPRAFVEAQELGDAVGEGLIFSRTSGVTLRELMIRRGRFGEAIAWAIARQVFAAIAHLEAASKVHGDIRTETVRLDENGDVSLLRCGVRPVLEPAILYRESLQPRSYVAIAPERIGTNRPATPASDRYALGCLLWELLAGRPLTPHGSALGCLRAHHVGELPDLGDFAPDTSNEFLGVIRGLLSAVPDERPVALESESHAKQAPKRMPRSAATRLVRTNRPVRSSPAIGSITTVAASIMLAAGAWLTWPAIQSSLAKNDVEISPVVVQASVETNPVRQQMPVTPDADGVLVLPGGELEASRIVWSGALTIAGASDGSTKIIVDTAWELFADTVTMERVTLVGAASPNPLVDIHSQAVIVRDSRILAAGRSAAIRWTALDSSDQTGRNLLIEQSRLDGDGSAIELTTDPRTVAFQDAVITEFRHVTKLARWSRSPARIVFDHCTARHVRSLIDCEDSAIEFGQRMGVTLRSSLFEPAGPTLVQTGDVDPNKVLARFPVEVAMSVSTRPWPVVAIGSRDGLQLGSLTFAGPSKGSDRDSMLHAADVPLPVDAWPGVRRFATVESGSDGVGEHIRIATQDAAPENMER